jgi:ABC-2 type transport system permease protein
MTDAVQMPDSAPTTPTTDSEPTATPSPPPEQKQKPKQPLKTILVGNLLAIYKKELQSYFNSPFAYVVAGVFWLITGIIFFLILQFSFGAVAQYDAQQQFGGPPAPPIDVPYEFLQSFLGLLGIVVIILMPMLSMGLYADERKRGTLELLATSPITNWAVALGKLLGVLTFFIGMVLPPMVYEAIVLSTSNPAFPTPVFLLSHLGLILMAASILSLGMFLSSLTESTILSVILTFIVVLILALVEGIGTLVGGDVGDALGHLSLLRHYNQMVTGVIGADSLALFGTYIVLGIFLTAQSIESLRFQRS